MGRTAAIGARVSLAGAAWFALVLAAALVADEPPGKDQPRRKEGPGTAGESQPAAAAAPDYRSLPAILRLIEEDARREVAGEKYPSLYNAAKVLLPKYQARAAQGDRDAKYKLGAMYLEGIGTHPDSGDAWQRFVEAGGPDHPAALVAHGRHLLKRHDDQLRDSGELAAVFEAIGKLGPAAAQAVPVLAKYLNRGYPHGSEAAVALAKIGDRGLPVLVAGLKDPDGDVRRSAAYGLSEVVEAAAAARDALRAALEDPDPAVRESADRALKRVQYREQKSLPQPAAARPTKEKPPARKVPAEKAPAERQAAERQADELVAKHIRGLNDPELAVRHESILALYNLKDRAGPAVPTIIKKLADPDIEMRRTAAELLKLLGPRAAPAIPALREMGLADDRYSRERALDAIVEIAPDSIADTAALITELESQDLPRRRRAAETLARLHGRAKPALPQLVKALKDEEVDVRAAATLALAEMREQARSAIDPLLAAARDPSERVRANVGHALTYIGPGRGHADVVPVLLKLLEDPVPAVRSRAAWAFGAGWSEEERAIPAIVRALADRGTNGGDGAAGQAAYALCDIAKNGHAPAVVAELLKLLEQKAPNVEQSAVFVLGRLGPQAKEAVPVLKRMLAERQGSAAAYLAAALTKIEVPPAAVEKDSAIAKLIACLHDDDNNDRERAFRALGELGPAAAPALGELTARLEGQAALAAAAFRKAADQGSPEGQYGLAMLLAEGKGTAADAVAAADLLRSAAEQGHREAQLRLGIFYRQGRGVPRDDAQAEVWYRKSVEPSAASELKYVPDWEEAYDELLSFCLAEPVTIGTEKVPLRVAVGAFRGDGGFATYRFVDRQGFTGGCDMRYNRSAGLPGRSGLRHTPQEIERLQRLLSELPAGVGFTPVAQRVIVATYVDGRWTGRTYDAEALPAPVRRLADLTGLQLLAAPYPPEEAESWPASNRKPIEVAFGPDGGLWSWGTDMRIDVRPEGHPADEADRKAYHLPGRPIAVAPAVGRVVVNRRGQVGLVDLPTGKIVAEVGRTDAWREQEHHGAFSADGQTLVMLDARNRRLSIFDGRAGTRRGVIELVGYFSGSPVVSPDGRLAAASGEKEVYLWDLAKLSTVRTFPKASHYGMAFSPDGDTLAIPDGSNLAVWDLKTGTQKPTPITSWWGPVWYSPDGKLLVEIRRRPLLRLHDAGDLRVLGIAGGVVDRSPYDVPPSNSVYSATFSPDGKRLATAGHDGQIRIWNLADVLE